MTKFNDAQGRQWSVEFDGLLLDDVLTNTGIDLADLSGGGLARLDEHAPSLIRVLTLLCAEEIAAKKLTPKEFAQAIRREAIPAAVEAVLGAAQDFFPKNVWSEIRSRLTETKQISEHWVKIKPLLRKLNEPDVPRAVQDAVMAALAEMIEGIDLQSLAAIAGAGGPADTPRMSAADSPESAESVPAA